MIKTRAIQRYYVLINCKNTCTDDIFFEVKKEIIRGRVVRASVDKRSRSVCLDDMMTERRTFLEHTVKFSSFNTVQAD